MRVHLIQKITAIFLLCCIILLLLPVQVDANEKEDTDNDVYEVIRVYDYGDSDYTYQNILNLTFPEVHGMEDEKFQENINFLIQQEALDDMFHELLLDVSYPYHEWNELGEPRRSSVMNSIHYSDVHLYGNILSINRFVTDMDEGSFTDWGTWEMSKEEMIFDVCNFDVTTGEEVKLNEILTLDDEFFETIEDVDITLYNEDGISVYNSFLREMKWSTTAFVDGTSDYKWFLDAQGNLHICSPGREGSDNFMLPLSLFEDIIRPEYKEYLDGKLEGYDFIYPMSDLSSGNASPDFGTNAESEEDLVFTRRTYQYGEDVNLEYFQVAGMSDISLQCKVNDFLLKTVLDVAVEELCYAYLNNGYYAEEDNLYDRESMIHVDSVLPNYYLSGPVLSFTHLEEVTRKAYTTRDGIRQEEKKKGSYLQAFNYDINKGKELTLGDVFEADDEFFYKIEVCFDVDPQFKDWPHQWGEDPIVNYRKAIGVNFNADMRLKEFREKFINGEVKYYHWFIDHDEEGNHLCIYKYYALDSEEKCLKIPMSRLKDKLKPEYEDCYYPGED